MSPSHADNSANPAVLPDTRAARRLEMLAKLAEMELDLARAIAEFTTWRLAQPEGASVREPERGGVRATRKTRRRSSGGWRLC